jgi:hypothetical protein
VNIYPIINDKQERKVKIPLAVKQFGGANTYFWDVKSNFWHIIFKKHLTNTYKKQKLKTFWGLLPASALGSL